jgi:hypothetical protein
LREIVEPTSDGLCHETLSVFDRERTDAYPVSEPEERRPVLLAQSLEPCATRQDGRESLMMLENVSNILRYLRTRNVSVDPFLELVELVQHEEHALGAGGFACRADKDLNYFFPLSAR